MILVDSDAYIIIKFVDIEVCDLNPTVSPEPILSALKQWDRDQDLPMNIQFLSTGCEGAQAWLQLSYNEELPNNLREQDMTKTNSAVSLCCLLPSL